VTCERSNIRVTRSCDVLKRHAYGARHRRLLLLAQTARVARLPRSRFQRRHGQRHRNAVVFQRRPQRRAKVSRGSLWRRAAENSPSTRRRRVLHRRPPPRAASASTFLPCCVISINAGTHLRQLARDRSRAAWSLLRGRRNGRPRHRGRGHGAGRPYRRSGRGITLPQRDRLCDHRRWVALLEVRRSHDFHDSVSHFHSFPGARRCSIRQIRR